MILQNINIFKKSALAIGVFSALSANAAVTYPNAGGDKAAVSYLASDPANGYYVVKYTDDKGTADVADDLSSVIAYEVRLEDGTPTTVNAIRRKVGAEDGGDNHAIEFNIHANSPKKVISYVEYPLNGYSVLEKFKQSFVYWTDKDSLVEFENAVEALPDGKDLGYNHTAGNYDKDDLGTPWAAGDKSAYLYRPVGGSASTNFAYISDTRSNSFSYFPNGGWSSHLSRIDEIVAATDNQIRFGNVACGNTNTCELKITQGLLETTLTMTTTRPGGFVWTGNKVGPGAYDLVRPNTDYSYVLFTRGPQTIVVSETPGTGRLPKHAISAVIRDAFADQTLSFNTNVHILNEGSYIHTDADAGGRNRSSEPHQFQTAAGDMSEWQFLPSGTDFEVKPSESGRRKAHILLSPEISSFAYDVKGGTSDDGYSLVLSFDSLIPADPDADTDEDGVKDINDAFPYDPTETTDSDGDGVGDNSDEFPNDPTETTDSDGDGVGDNGDAFPNDPSETLDSDGDGVGDNLDAFPNDPSMTGDMDGDGIDNKVDDDIDGDGYNNDVDLYPRDATDWADMDGDGIGDNADNDTDGDGYDNHVDQFPLNPIKYLNRLDDVDNDGILNGVDAFPWDATESVDTDMDGIGDNSDDDIDGDGVANADDAFPLDKSKDLDDEGDFDNDGVKNKEDAFPRDNSETTDTDGDGIGDNSDDDIDGDGFENTVDAYPLDKDKNLDPALDFDEDGVSNADDAFPRDSSETLDTDEDGIGNNADLDDDNDGVEDSLDSEPLDPKHHLPHNEDQDGDGVLNIDDEFDYDPTESVDTDMDGIGNNLDLDDDNDGVTDDIDAYPLDSTRTSEVDTDGDGIPDEIDEDDDNDGYPDLFDADPKDSSIGVRAETLEQSGGSTGLLFLLSSLLFSVSRRFLGK